MSVLEAAIGWLAPPDCLACGTEGEALCQNCSQQLIKPFGERCWRCNKLSPNSKTCKTCLATGPLKHVWISTVYDGAAQDLVQKYKFGHMRAASLPLARLMAQTDGELDRDYLIVPVPTATTRARQRGFGHSELLAKQVAANLGCQYSNALLRFGQSRQLGARREDRLKQLAGSFAVKNHRKITGRKILLIDDVLTTGGTLTSAAKVLKQAGAVQIDGLIFAKRL